MADNFITVNITGLPGAQARLAKLGASLMDFTLAFESLARQLILFYSQTVFGSEGRALGEGWPQLKDKTLSYKNSRWPGRGMLVRTGDMQEGFYDDVTPVSLFISNRMPYFPYHQLGTASGPGRGHNIPARPMLGVNEAVSSIIKQVIEADVRAKIDGGI